MEEKKEFAPQKYDDLKRITDRYNGEIRSVEPLESTMPIRDLLTLALYRLARFEDSESCCRNLRLLQNSLTLQ